MKRQTIKKSLFLIATVAMIITQTACNSNKMIEPVTGQNYYLDTICDVSVYEINGGLDEKEADAAIDAAFDRCRELDKKLSNTVEASEVSKINRSGGEWVSVSDDTMEVIRKSIEYGRLSDGDFDITIGTVTALWDFHAEKPLVPDKELVSEAVKHVDYNNIEIDDDASAVRVKESGARIDLGGIAKGYIGGEMAETLESLGVTSAIINLGGNIVAVGSKPDGKGGVTPFMIGIEKPFSDRTEIIGSTSAEDRTVVTSGVYERMFKVKGKIYHHILSTETGYPIDTDLDSVTLIADKSMATDLDALSTICLIKGSSGGKKFIEEIDGVEALFCKSNGDIIKTSGMEFDEE